jgi:pimeloyl-ACP methyl ester carboxylesterase
MDICLAEDQTRVALVTAPLRPMPLSVLTHGKPPSPPDPETDAQERLWQRLQNELAAMLPGSRHVIATRSGHDIPRDQPDLVLAEIRRVVAAVRSGSPSLTG